MATPDSTPLILFLDLPLTPTFSVHRKSRFLNSRSPNGPHQRKTILSTPIVADLRTIYAHSATQSLVAHPSAELSRCTSHSI